MATNLEGQLREQLTAALKAKDLKTANLIRMINTKITERRTADGFSGTVDDALVLDVIGKYKKAMEKAKQEFVNVGERGKDQVAELDFELVWLAKWLPQGLSETECREGSCRAAAERSEDGRPRDRRDQEAVWRPRGRAADEEAGGRATRLVTGVGCGSR
jgi:uncharacterized protein YqeY